MLSVYHVPIASLAVPISVLVSMPIRIVPVIVRVHRGAARAPCTTSAAFDFCDAVSRVPNNAKAKTKFFIMLIEHAIQAKVTIFAASAGPCNSGFQRRT